MHSRPPKSVAPSLPASAPFQQSIPALGCCNWLLHCPDTVSHIPFTQPLHALVLSSCCTIQTSYCTVAPSNGHYSCSFHPAIAPFQPLHPLDHQLLQPSSCHVVPMVITHTPFTQPLHLRSRCTTQMVSTSYRTVAPPDGLYSCTVHPAIASLQPWHPLGGQYLLPLPVVITYALFAQLLHLSSHCTLSTLNTSW